MAQDPASILSKYGTEGLSAMSGLNPYAMAGSAILGGIELVGGYRNLAKANKMPDPSFMSGAGELQQQKARYGRLYDTGISTGQEDTMREKFRANITGLQRKFKETARQGSSVFSRLAGLNINEGERAIMEADIQQRNMGLRGLGSTAESLTNIAMRDIGTTKDDKRNAIQAAGRSIASGYGGLASAVNFMGMTRDGSGIGSSPVAVDPANPTSSPSFSTTLKSNYQPLPNSMGGIGGMRPSVDTMVDYETLPYELGGSGGLRKPITLQKVKY
jgi:hypothetical protein